MSSQTWYSMYKHLMYKYSMCGQAGRVTTIYLLLVYSLQTKYSMYEQAGRVTT